MIIDLNQPSVEIQSDYDVCIVGAGAIGLALAVDLVRDGNVKVAVFECGGRIGRPSLDLDVENVGDVPSALAGSRAYGLGGSTSIWGGQALPFNSIDFETRAWVNFAEWPISESEVLPYYLKTEHLFGVEGAAFGSNYCAIGLPKDTLSSFADQGVDLSFSKFSPQPNFATKFDELLLESNNLHCYLNASVCPIESRESGHIDALSLTGGCVAERHIKASSYVLACGGVDTPKYLLEWDLSFSKRLPVGNFYQDHIGIYGARLEPLNIKKFRALFATRLHQGVKCLPKLNLSKTSQIDKQTLNITGNLETAINESNESSPLTNMRLLYSRLRAMRFDRPFWLAAKNLLIQPHQLFGAALEIMLYRRVYIPDNAEYFLIANIESEPDRDSNLSLTRLSTLTDSENTRKTVCLDWKVSEQSRVAALEYYQRIKAVLEQNGIARVLIKEELSRTDRSWLKHCYGLYHHMGGTRMSNDQKLGVVDSDCKVHGMSNLYIAGPSVLPTGSASNPTFTSLALALRLSHHLSNKLNIKKNSNRPDE